MAGRSTPPALCLASAQPSMRRVRSRPRFARIPSASASTPASSTHAAARSDESLTSTLKSLTFADAKEIDFLASGISGDGESPSRPSPGPPASPTRQSYLEESHGRRQSKPINIEAPKRQPAYTPLSARGDIPGGYFPNHETFLRQYKPHPFFKTPDSASSSPIMSNTSSSVSSPSGTTTRVAQSIVSPAFSTIPSSETSLAVPVGKYHPSNYKPVSPSAATASTRIPSTPPPTQLEIPSSGKNKRPAYERRTSDVKRKLQQYQRDMIAQARLADIPTATEEGGSAKPASPKLQPLGSPGPITPLELEESTGYMVAGTRGSDREREMEIVERMIEREKNVSKGSGSGSPVLRV